MFVRHQCSPVIQIDAHHEIETNDDIIIISRIRISKEIVYTLTFCGTLCTCSVRVRMKVDHSHRHSFDLSLIILIFDRKERETHTQNS